MKKALIILVVISLQACSYFSSTVKEESKPTAAATTETRSSTVKSSPVMTTAKAVSAEEIAEGKSLFESSCADCHKLKNPADFTESQLNKIVPKMAAKAKITPEQGTKILNYMISASSK